MGWIVIPNWDRFQHYKDRDPKWIKDHVSQLHDDDWSSLSMSERGALQTVRMMYAVSDGKLARSAALRAISLRGNHGLALLNALNDAGLIAFSASKPLSLTRSREKRREEKKASASAEPKNQLSMNGQLEPASTAVDEEMLRLARGWIDGHQASG